MAAVSMSVVNGVGTDNFIQFNNITVAASAPGAGDFEFRWNTSDALGNVVGRDDVIHAVQAFLYALENQSFFTTASSG